MLLWQRIDPEGPGLHSPKRAGDVGYDLEAAITIAIAAGKQLDVPTNVRVKLPPACWGEIRARSSIARKGLQVDAGILDNGYTGPALVLIRNMNSHAVVVGRGERIAQLVLHPMVQAEAKEQAFEDDPRRGTLGFGSTGA